MLSWCPPHSPVDRQSPMVLTHWLQERPVPQDLKADALKRLGHNPLGETARSAGGAPAERRRSAGG
ncbi:hypothetical protein EYF80_045657 [Liparis tanakae]|uniref:Uncharacterized protein n=1 Tax=Liparis tanakae TaxID=230148 RepID=A0A4Z2FSK4_9TELE|nr:hypothetical protein EYF80_045657 [Liparis tanakae]